MTANRLDFGSAGRAARRLHGHLEVIFGGPDRTRVILVLGAVLGLSTADAATVGASATQLRHALHIGNTDIGLLVTISSLVAAVASIPFGVLADRVNRTRTMSISVVFWAAAMLWSSLVSSFGQLMLARLFLGVVTAASGPVVASMVGDYFPSGERGRVYSYILTGELIGAGVGFGVTGDLASISWRLAFVILAIPALLLAPVLWRLPEPARGGSAPLIGPDETAATGAAPAGRGRQEGGETERNGRTDAQDLATEKGIEPNLDNVLRRDANKMRLWAVLKYVLSIRSNVILIIAGSFGYFYLAGMETFAVEFVKEQYGINQALANLLLLVVGIGAVIGVLGGGSLSDWLLRKKVLNARISVAAVAAVLTAGLFLPAIISRSAVSSVPYLFVAAAMRTAQNPPTNAARLDIMPALLWGRAEGIRTLFRTAAQSLAPVMFGGLSDLLGGGRSALEWTFAIMLLPLLANGVILFMARRSYPTDVATAGVGAIPRVEH